MPVHGEATYLQCPINFHTFMPYSSLPSDVIRFVLTSIPSVPHLEALLLLHQDSAIAWKARDVGSRLYIPEKKAEMVLVELAAAGILADDSTAQSYCFAPSSTELREVIDKLAEVYAKQIIAVTNLIHSKADNQVQQFADAFKLRKDS